MRSQTRFFVFKLLLLCSVLLCTNLSYGAVETIPAGSKIINMGVLPQTAATGLKPYGLVYALLKQNVPVKWVINQSKIKDGIDFVQDGVSYRGGTFIIRADYLNPAINTLISSWITKGVVVNTTTTSFNIDVTYTLTVAPKWVMDAANGKIAVAYLNAAEVPSSAYIFKAPSQLTNCDDIFVMPHADPTWPTHKNLWYWNLSGKGAIWLGCHAVSVLEDTYGPDINTPATIRRMNFLMNDGATGPDQNAVLFKNHKNGSPPYNFQFSAQPVMQFIGKTDKAHTNGSEQIYLPYKGNSWRPSTFIGAYDPSQADIPSKSDGKAALIAFGRGFGDTARGMVMYEAGHSLAGNAPENIAAQRAFLNFSFVSATDKQVTVVLSGVPPIMTAGTTYNGLTATASSKVAVTFTYQWSSSIAGTFTAPTGAVTSFTPNTVSVATTGTITCKVTDNCGRVSFDTRPVTIVPAPRAPVCASDVGFLPSCTNNSVTVNVLANDVSPDGYPLTTVTLMSTGTNGTFSNLGNGNIQYVPNANFYTGTDQVQYKVCDSRGLCCTSTLTINVALANPVTGCGPNQFYGVVGTINGLRNTVVAGSPTNKDYSLGDPDGDVADATTYTSMGSGQALVYFLESAIPANGIINFYVHATGNGRTFQVEESADSITWKTPQSFTVNTTDQFLQDYVKKFNVTAGTKYLRVTGTGGTIWYDALEYEIKGCISAAPVAVNDNINTSEDVPVTIAVANNDVDPQGLFMVVSQITTQPKKGKVSINTDGTITYLNFRDQNGLDSFSYRICNTLGLCAIANVYVTITADGCAPGMYKPVPFNYSTVVINPTSDTYISSKNPTNNYSTASSLMVKGKSTDKKRSLLSFNLSAIPAGAIIDSATLSLFRTSGFNNENVSVYQVTKNWTGSTVTWNKAGGPNWATPGGDYNAASVATANTGFINNTYINWNVQSLVQGWYDGTINNNGLELIRSPEGSGTKDIKFNSLEAASDKPKLTVNYKVPAPCTAIPAYAPLAMPDTATTNSVTPVSINVSANDYNYNGGSLTVSLNGTTSKKGGTLTLSGNTIIYTPPATSPAFNGLDTFMYKVCSGSLCDLANVFVNVTNAPPFANTDSAAMLSNTATTPNTVTVNVLANDYDPELSGLSTPVIVQYPANGAANISGTSISYTPNLNFIGSDTLIYQISELTGTGCTLLTDTAMVIFKVNNRPPVAVSETVNINPCETTTVLVTSNDNDPEGGNLTVTITTPPSAGTATVVNSNSQIKFSPPPGVAGATYTIGYIVCDNASPSLCSTPATLTVNIRTLPVNNPPIAVRDTFITNYNQVLLADVLTNDIEPDNQEFVVPVTIVTNPTKGTVTPLSNGLVEYTPNVGYFGVDSFQYRVYDSIDAVLLCAPASYSLSATAWAYIKVQVGPIANADRYNVAANKAVTLNILSNDIFGTDGPAPGTISVITAPMNGTFSIDSGALSNQSDDQIIFTPAAGYTGRDSLIYQITDASGNSDTAIVYLRVWPDTDKDGIADFVDIDDDNDGIVDVIEVCGNGAVNFSCTTAGTDPAADDDDDGIINWKDADYGLLNANGCVASLDSDGDGIPNFLDLDSDNDGIADVVEAYGADTNGDGIIDSFADTDGDGLSQNVDANNTGAAGSGGGLGFIDTDGDGVSNTLDLDSDNDGIPDIVEALTPDVNNDGRGDTFIDINKNGLNDSYENATAVLQTGADTNGDGRADSYPNKNTDQTGKPNPYDLDSDGDGITDALEAGFPVSVTVLNGMVTGARTNGWANSVKALGAASLALVNTDSRGPVNFLDIDSDDDGISDNIEGQPTAAYKVPTGIDSDNDGLDDIYETMVGVYGGEGITPNDEELDGIPDYKDSDTDNDGLLDINEASKINTLTQANINIADTDGDGLVDQFDNLDVKTAAAASVRFNVSNSNMGANGITAGPVPSGSNVLLIQSLPSYTNRDWRILNTLTLGNQVWYDFNGNGLKDAGETAVSGAIVNVYLDANADNIPDGGAVISTTTDATGTYQVTGLSKNKYIVGVVLPAGYVMGNTIASSLDPNNGIDNDNNGVNLAGSEVRSNNINLLANSNTLDIGLKGTGSLGDYVWFDINANGIQDAGEVGIAGVSVSLTNSGGLSITTSTNAGGLYTFANLAPGTYTVAFTTPAGYVASPALQGSDNTKDSDPAGGTASVTLTAGQNNPNIDAGFYQTVNLGNLVWYDVNLNGLRDAGEPGVSGATVKLYLDANNDNIADGAAIATTTTNASGIYGFAGLVPNNYIVGVTLPAGYAMVPVNGGDPDNDIDNDNNGINLVGGEVRSNAITLNSGTEPTSDGDGPNGNLTLDFALTGTASIGDFVWNDVNGNGIQDVGETGIAGVTVTATAAGIGTLTTVTNASGNYTFSNLPPGTFTLTFTTPAGYFVSPANQGSDITKNSDPTGGSVSVTLTAGQVKTDIDAGFYLPYTLGNAVWFDRNNNGIKDPGEPPVAGASVRLYNDNNGDNIPDGAAIAATTTDVNGDYMFSNLAAGKYIVGVVLPAGYAAGTTTATSSSPDNGIDNDNNAVRTVSGEARTNFITMSANNNTLDIGLRGTASIGDFVWNDVNGNGVQDAGEAGLAGVSVMLTAPDGSTVTTTTSTAGAYSFTNLLAGTYTVSFTTPATYYPSPPGRGTSTTGSDPVNGSVSVTLTAGQVRTDIDAGFFLGYTLGNKIWFDADNNGLLGAGEGGLPGLTVNLYTDTLVLNTPDGPAIATTTTDGTGTYQFTKLPPGTYLVSVIMPAGYGPTATTASSANPDNGTDNDNNGVRLNGSELFTNNITLNSLNNTVDIGLKGSGTIGDFVFNDLNNDGIQDAGEPGMPGVSVTLTTAGGTTVTTTTNASGNYLFNNLLPLTYIISFATPAGYVASAAAQGADVTKDSDPVGGSVTVSLATGQSTNDIDAGFFVPSTLGNLVWYDFNNNGLKDASETGVSGATVNLYNDANGDNIADGPAIATTTTNASGIYQFTGLPIRKYIVGVALNGYAAGAATATSFTPDNGTDNDNNGINTVGTEIRSNYISLNGTNNTLDFGLAGTGSIGDFVWNDVNGNGIQEAGEVGLAGITVTLTNSTGMVVTTTTNSSGQYSFSAIAPGTYTVGFTTPSGYFASPAGQGANAALNSDPVGGSVSVTLTAGQIKTDIDAGFYLPFTLGNAIWYDFNSNGLKDANETGIAGATVYLYTDNNADNIADGAAIATTTTDASGNYQFTNLSSGKYIIGVVVPSGYTKGVTITGSTTPDNGIDNDNNGIKTVGSETRTNYISLNSNNNTLDIGLVGDAGIGNFVWKDVNANGLQDAGEAGLPGVSVTLSNGTGLTLNTVTNASGVYSFANLYPGTYSLSFATPSGYFASPAKAGTDDTKDSDPVNGTVSVTLTSGQTNNNIDAGFYIPFSLGNQVFYDFNNNGLANVGETGVEGAVVHLYNDNNADNVPDGAAIDSTTTDANGIYQFTSLPVGNYIVGVSAAGFAAGATTVNSANPNSNTDNDNNGVVVAGGEIRSNYITVNANNNTLDFGLKGTGLIGDYTWIDDNGNGVQDAGELPLAGVQVTLTNSGGIVLTVNTNSAGYYSFTNIAPGTYTVTFKTPNGYILTSENQGTDRTKDSDPIDLGGNTASVNVTVGPGEIADYIDAGYFIPFPLGNLVFFDLNNNGVKDANERGIGGLTVNLYDDKNFDNIPDGGVRKTTTTDAAGAYLFTNLRANGYIVGVVMPPGYVPGATTSTSADPNNQVNNDNNGVVVAGSIVRTNNINVSSPRYDVDFALKGTASIGDYVWFDANSNGLQDAGETGLAGVTVTISQANGASLSTTSDSAGFYTFTGLIPGTYTLTFITPLDHSPSPAAVGADRTKDSDPVNGVVTLTLTAGQARTDIDAGYNASFALGNTVWYDFDNNGLRDVGETGISGATVKLYADANADNIPDGAALATLTTDANGNYQFGNLAAGKFIVGVTLPSGYVLAANTSTSSTPDNYIDDDNNGVRTISGEVRTNYITLNSSSNTLDIGLTGTGSIGDFVWNDVNKNGVQNTGEPGLSGVTVTLTYTAGPTRTTTSNSSGIYSFPNLAPATYTIRFSTPFGYVPTAALQGSDRTKDSDPSGGTASIAVTAGQARTDVDAGFYLSLSLGDQVWYDINNNGVKDAGETGISGATVKLYVDANADNIPDGAPTQSKTTDANGLYAFTGLASGKYIVGVVLPAGYIAGATTAGSANPDNNIDNDNNGINIVGSEVRSNYITVSSSNSTLDFGLKGTASIGDLVFNDRNGNGIQEAGEPGIAGATITLSGGGLILTTTTNASGIYSFANLAPATYTLTFTTPAGFTASPSLRGADTTLDSNPSGGNVVITLNANEVRTDVDAGFYQAFSIGDLVWDDYNGNGIKDAAETGISGATVYLYQDANADNIADGPAIATTTTNASGGYQFLGVPSGNYIIGVLPPAGYIAGNITATSADPNNNIDNDNNGVNTVGLEVRSNFILLSAATNTVDVALKGIGSIGNFVWHDANGNGLQDAGEAGISGVVVSVTNSAGNTITAISNSGGFYSFANLAPGTYTVTFITPSGYIASPSLRGSDRTIDSDPSGGSVSVTLTAGQSNADVDAGFYPPYTLGNKVWYDFNNNGLNDAGETGIAGAVVNLYADANADNIADGAAIATTTTNASGNYQFSNLPSGNYIVGVVLPAGYVMGTTTATSANPNNGIDDDNNGVSLVAGEVQTRYIITTATNNTIDIGLTGTGSIGDLVFNDTNGNGIQDAGEIGLPSVTVRLTNTGGMTITTSSDATGNYVFTNLAAGTYTIGFTAPSGYIASAALQGADRTKDSDPSNGIASVTITAGQARTDIDAGFYQPFSLGDLIWFDVDNNGLRDAGEPGISGATVRLYADANGDNVPDGAALATTATDSAGRYQFINLAAGNYIIGVAPPAGYSRASIPASGLNPNNNTDNDNNGIYNVAGEVRTNYITLSGVNNTLDIGLAAPGSIGNFVWLDANGNGIQDSAETGIAGVTVTLTNSVGTTKTATTDANGYYNFSSLLPDTYIVHFATPARAGAPKVILLIPRRANAGGDVTKDSDPDPATGNVTVVLGAGEVNSNIDAGFSYDQDDDDDGIPNIIENKGYDPFADGDGDGIPNYLDPTQINGIPGNPLVWKDVNNDGINDWFDFDLDGILNELDLDSDNDGIVDIQETRDSRAVDANKDGMADGIDNDGDGIPATADQDDNLYGALGLIAQDMDLDGTPNFLDLDSDGDGITDYTEATGLISAKGMVTGTDSDRDGILAETFGSSAPNVADNINGFGGKGITLRDSDGDSKPDAYDIDSDNDGIIDNIEAQSSAGYVIPSATDTDGDGIADSYDTFNGLGGTGLTPYDFDADGVPDHLDLDTDNDGIADNIEWQLGSSYVLATPVDADNDGLADVYDTLPNSFGGGKTPQDSDGDGLADFRDRDSDNDGIPDVVEAYGVDVNGDGILDNFTDTDADGLSQNIDANITGISGSGLGLGFDDQDGDKVRNSIDLDSDNDGIPDIVEAAGADINNDGKVDVYTDTNGNGWNDAYETTGALIKTGPDANNDGRADSYPNKNTDGAGLPDPYDLDSDGDGLADQIEAGFAGTSGIVAGTIGTNGWSTTISSLAALNLSNTDGNGPADYLDLDSDDDGVTDNQEWQTSAGYVAPTNVDTDNDGISDVYDALPNSYGGGKMAVDTDGDGVADYKDLDSDNDGIADIAEWKVAATYVAPATTDADNDGILDAYDPTPTTFGGINVIPDTDGDIIPDYRDGDSDNDGIPDVVEAFGTDTNGDGIIDSFIDNDRDGLSDNVDANIAGYAASAAGLGYVDFDGDGVMNSVDLDSDNDGIPDIVEVLALDANNDGRVDGFTDANGNGLKDSYENAGALLITGPDTNGDGKADSWPNKNADLLGKPNPYDLDADGDGLVDAVEAGFTVTINNGLISGARTNGWANSISALPGLNLANTDGRGNPDYLDIDSDDDGISDNVEGQPTFSYVVATDADTDGDGLADVYDVAPTTYGGNGITPYDHDSDGIPDYIDADADNDGAPDINEASLVFTINQSNINTVDSDGDGMVDQFDNLDMNTLSDGIRFKNVTNSQMAASGGWDGPVPSGSKVQLVRSLAAGDRDWRSTYILPLRILSFTGFLKNNIAQLQWKAQNEQEVDHYLLQRSKDAVSFQTVANVKARNATTSVYDHADDIAPVNSTMVYYKVMQVNKAGEIFHSNVIAFKKEQGNEIKMKVYPNPVQNKMTLDITIADQKSAKAMIYDAAGKAVLERSLQLERGENSITFDNMARLAKGLYNLLVVIDGKTYVERIIKE